MEFLRDSYGRTFEGQVDKWPWSTPVINSKVYGGVLSVDQRVDLYDTIVHESWHYDKQSFYSRGTLPSENEARAQADARTARDEAKIRKSANSCGECSK